MILIKSQDLSQYDLEPGWYFDRETSGWKTIPESNLEIVPIPGDHLSIILEENIDILAQTLAAQIKNAQHPR